MSPCLLLLLLAGSSHGATTPTWRPTPRMTRSPTPAPSLSAPTFSYVVTTHYTDSNCSAGAFHQSVEALGGCFVAFSADGSQDATGSVQSAVANSSADPLTIVTSTYSISFNCSGNATQSEEPLQTEVCLPSSQFVGASYVTEITSHASAPSISIPGPLFTTAYFSSQADCDDRNTATKITAFAADACIPSDAGGSVVYHNPLRPLRVDYLTPNCTGQGSIVDFTELTCSLNVNAASAQTSFVQVSFPAGSAASRETAPGYLSTTFFNNRTGQAYLQQFSKYDSSLCSLEYMSVSDDPTVAAPIQSSRTYVGRVLPGSAHNLDYYYSAVYYASLDCTGSINVSSWIVQNGLKDTYHTQVSYIHPSSPVPPAFSLQGFVITRWASTSTCADATKIDSTYVQPVGTCLPEGPEKSAIIVNDYNQGRILSYASSNCQGRPEKLHLAVYSCKQSAGSNSNAQTFSSSPSESYMRTMYYLNLAWYLRVSVAAVGSLCGLAMVALLLDLGKWTDFNCIVFALALLQICVDASFMADQHRDTPQPEYFVLGADKQSSRRFYLVNTARYFFTIATSYTSNLLTIMVVYVVTLQRSLSLRKNRTTFIWLGFAIFVISFMPTSIFALHEYDVFDHKGKKLFAEDNTNEGSTRVYNRAVNAVRYVIVASIAVNTLGLVYISLKTVGRGGMMDRSLRVTMEISKRLSIYPLIQVLTLAPALWYDLQYFSSGSVKDDDNYYKTQSYVAAWLLQSALTPSGGIWFFLLLLHFSPEIRARLYMRYCHLVGRPHEKLSRGSASSAKRVQHYIHCHLASVKAKSASETSGPSKDPSSASDDASAEPGASCVQDEIPLGVRESSEGRGGSGSVGSDGDGGASETNAGNVVGRAALPRLLPPPVLSDFDEDELAAIVDGLYEKETGAGAGPGGVGTGESGGQGGLLGRVSRNWSHWRGTGGGHGGEVEQGSAFGVSSTGRLPPPRRPGSMFEHADSFSAGHAGADLMMVDNPLASVSGKQGRLYFGSGGAGGDASVVGGGVSV